MAPAKIWDELATYLDNSLFGQADLQVGFVYGAHGCGKTTELIPRLWRNFIARGDEGITFVYAQSTALENALFGGAKLSWGDKPPRKFVDDRLPGHVVETSEMGLTTIKRLAEGLSTGDLPDNTVLVLDQPVTISVDWYMLHGHLRAARDKKTGAGAGFFVQVVILSPYELGNSLKHLYRGLRIAELSMKLPARDLADAPCTLELQAMTPRIVGCLSQGRKVVSFLDPKTTAELLAQAAPGAVVAPIRGKSSLEQYQNAVAAANVVGLDPLEFGGRLPIPNVGLVLSPRQHASTMLVDNSSVVYSERRCLTLSEARLQQSYAAEGTDVCCDYLPGDVVRAVHCSALNRDIFAFVLSLCRSWPGKTLAQMPTDLGQARACLMVTEFFRRARILEIVQCNENTGGYSVRGRAAPILNLLRSGYSIFLASLLFCGPPTTPERSRRLLARMVAVFAGRSAISEAWDAALSSPENLAKACSGAAKGLGGQGTLWISLGIWTTLLSQGNCLGKSISKEVADKCHGRVAFLEQQMGLQPLQPQQERDLLERPLMNHERAGMQLAMAHAGLFQTVFLFADEKRGPVELVAMQPVQLTRSAYLLSEQKEDRVVIATSMIRRTEPGPRFDAAAVTEVPRGALQDVAKQYRMAPPQLILTTAWQG